jgi:hypothetical protein
MAQADKKYGPGKLYINNQLIGECKPGTIKMEKPEVCPGTTPCTFTVTYNFTVLPDATDAAKMIAELRPIRFPQNLAGQLGNRCVRALLSRFPKG